MMRTDRMSWTDYEKRLRDKPVLFLPVGAHEQHGPHLPMGTDAIFAMRMAESLADRLDGLVLPTLSYGYKSQARSGGGQTFPGTTSLDGKTLIAMTTEILRELARHGVKKLVVLDGHYENQWFLTEGIELAQREFALAGQDMKVIRTEYWDFCPQSVLDSVFDGDFPGYDLEHAALIETSMMLHWHPELVDEEKIPADGPAQFDAFDHYPQDAAGVPPSGVLAPALGASPEKGRMIIEGTLDALEERLRNAFGMDVGDA
ncbi:MAG: creatininase [Gammaproteobacteria bacterium]|nr:creatininase [Gammaproteobacteria bacterium]